MPITVDSDINSPARWHSNALATDGAPRPAPSLLYSEAERISDAVARYQASEQSEPSRAYIVGGWCRNHLLGKSSNDIDMEAFGISHAQLSSILVELFGERVIIPKHPGIAPFKLTFGQHGWIDINIPVRCRRNSPGEFGIYALDPTMRLDQAASRRDFTCNAIYLDPINGSTIDLFNGSSDIRDGVLRLLPSHTRESINPSMLLRACRIAAQFDLVIEPESKALLKEMVALGSLQHLPKINLTHELEKMLCVVEPPSKALRIADEMGILEALLPEVSCLRKIEQCPVHHPEGSVFEHTMRVIDVAARLSRGLPSRQRFTLALAALLHDTGKALTAKPTVKSGIASISFPGHERASEELSKKVLTRLELCRSTKQDIRRMVSNHMKPLELQLSKRHARVERLDNAVRQIVRAIHPRNVELFQKLCEADVLGRGGANHEQVLEMRLGPFADSINRNRGFATADQTLLSGKDLVSLGFIDAGDLFKEIILGVEKARDRGAIQSQVEAGRYVLRVFALGQEAGLASRIKELNSAHKESLFRALRAAIDDGTVQTVGQIHRWTHEHLSRVPE